MKNIFFHFFLLLMVLASLVTVVGAAEVILDNNTLLVKGVDDSKGIGAFSVVLSYTGNVSIQSIEGKSGFLIASNIQNEDGQTLIAGISTEGLTGDIPVALITKTGNGNIQIFVRDLGNVEGDPISYINEDFVGIIPTPASGGGDTTWSETSGSQTGGMPPGPVITTGTPSEAAVKATEMPSDTLVPSETSEISTSVISVETPVVSETDAKKPTPTRSPLSIVIILVSIASIYIFKTGK